MKSMKSITWLNFIVSESVRRREAGEARYRPLIKFLPGLYVDLPRRPRPLPPPPVVVVVCVFPCETTGA